MSAPEKTGALCTVCPQACRLDDGEVGRCGARYARDGTVRSGTYGKVTSCALDPVEKKPLARFYPGSKVVSVGSFGCNLRCAFCQNHTIACMRLGEEAPYVRDISSHDLVERALDLRSRGNIGIAFTYNEPLIGFEYVRDTARLAHEAGLKNVVVSNGYATAKTVRDVFAHIDAANIDLKGFSQDFYDLVGAPHGFETVKSTIRYAAQLCHVEVTTLVIPDLNDSTEQMDAQARWLADINVDMPLHISRFFPAYRMREGQPTPIPRLQQLADVARRHLRFVFVGNVG